METRTLAWSRDASHAGNALPLVGHHARSHFRRLVEDYRKREDVLEFRVSPIGD